MRETFEHAGKTVKVKQGVGKGLNCGDMSGQDFVIEDWCENVLGKSWKVANGNPAALEYAARTGFNGDHNNVPVFSDDVVYGKIGPYGHLFHVNELDFSNLSIEVIQ